MKDLYTKKNAGYAGDSPDPWANFRECESFGINIENGIITRMSDKWSRIRSLWKNPDNEKVGETVEDTLKDLAAYALILVCILRETESINPACRISLILDPDDSSSKIDLPWSKYE
jgi:nitrogen regulatory protein PII-like uncharacterized protein